MSGWWWALGLSGCGAAQRRATRAEGHYALGAPGAGWSPQSPGGADFAWVDDTTGATIYSDSNCASRYEDGDLSDLATHLTFGIATGLPVREEPRTVDGRDALLRVVDGSLDGVQVRVGAVVLKKDSCIYDLLYIAPPTTFDSGWDAFERVLSDFHTEKRD